MTRAWIGAALTLLLAMTSSASPARGATESAAARTLGGDHFAAGCPVRIDSNVAGDLFAAGCSVDVGAAVGGDAFITGGNVRIEAPIGQTLYAAGGQVRVDGSINRNARIAGGDVDIGPKASIGGNVTVAGGEVRIDGAVKGAVGVAGGRLRINGPVEGDVVATSGAVELGSSARIAGKLRYASRAEVRRDPAAQVQGGVERMQVGGAGAERAERGIRRAFAWAWSIGLMVIAALLVAALPDFHRRVSQTLRTRVGTSLLLGFVVLVCIPVAALLLLLTIVGAPLALGAVLFYVGLLLLAYVSAGIALGDWALGRFAPVHAPQRSWRIGAVMLGMLLISLLGRLPFVGTLIVLLALLIGLGALLLQMRGSPAAAT